MDASMRALSITSPKLDRSPGFIRCLPLCRAFASPNPACVAHLLVVFGGRKKTTYMGHDEPQPVPKVGAVVVDVRLRHMDARLGRQDS